MSINSILLQFAFYGGGAALLAGPLAWKYFTRPEFTPISQDGPRTEIAYTIPNKFPAAISLEVSAVRAFSKSQIGEELVLREKREGGNVITIKRITNGELGGEFDISYNGAPAQRRSLHTSLYPSGL